MIATNKRCPTCFETKPREDFSPDKDRKDGLFYQCKKCKAAKSRASYVRVGRPDRARRPEQSGAARERHLLTFTREEKARWRRNYVALYARTHNGALPPGSNFTW